MIITTSALRLVLTQEGSTERAVFTYGEVSTGLLVSEIAKKPAEFHALHGSRLAGAVSW